MNTPKLHESVYIAPGARILGDVSIEENCSVWHNAVIRGDSAPIHIGAGRDVYKRQEFTGASELDPSSPDDPSLFSEEEPGSLLSGAELLSSGGASLPEVDGSSDEVSL